MAGTKGMTHSRVQLRRHPIRNCAWRTMRIMRRFTVTDLQRTIPDGDSIQCRRVIQAWLRRLAEHGYIATDGVRIRRGECTIWRLVRDCGPDYPQLCDECGQPVWTDHHLPAPAVEAAPETIPASAGPAETDTEREAV